MSKLKNRVRRGVIPVVGGCYRWGQYPDSQVWTVLSIDSSNHCAIVRCTEQDTGYIGMGVGFMTTYALSGFQDQNWSPAEDEFTVWVREVRSET